MPDDIAIKVDSVSKTFKLPHEKTSSLKGAFINVFNTKRTYEKQQVLKDISFEIKKGEFFGIVGRNGSGKSTLLKLLAGIYTPDKGEIHINGKLTPFIELGVGFNPELTGRENVFLNGALLGFNRKEMNTMYQEIVDFAEIEKFMDQKLKNYSSGMQVRLAFSIAIRANSDILVLDEVLAVGDANFQKKCFDYFGRVKNANKTVVLVTHDMSAVERFCDRALLLNEGNIVELGDTAKITKKYSDLNMDDQSKNLKVKTPNNSNSPVKVHAQLIVANKATNTVHATDKKFTLLYDIMSNIDIPKAVFATIVFNGAGTPIFATNTKVNSMTLDIKMASKLQVKLELDNIFANGEYSVSAGIKNYDQTNIYFAEIAAMKFLVGGRKHDFALTNPDFELSIS